MGQKKTVVKYDPDKCGFRNLIETVSEVLENDRMGSEAKTMKRRIKQAQSLNEVLEIIGEYVTLKPTKKHRR